MVPLGSCCSRARSFGWPWLLGAFERDVGPTGPTRPKFVSRDLVVQGGSMAEVVSTPAILPWIRLKGTGIALAARKKRHRSRTGHPGGRNPPA